MGHPRIEISVRGFLFLITKQKKDQVLSNKMTSGTKNNSNVFYRHLFLLVFLLFVLCLLILISASMGYIQISLSELAQLFTARILGLENMLEQVKELHRTVVIDVRLPRIFTAAAVGAGLALSGVVYQGILLNPLADPYTLGVSSGAAFGASIVLLFNLNFFGAYTIPVFAFVFSGLTLLFVIYLSSSAGGISSNNLILSGIIMTAILSAAISFCKYLAQEKVSIIIFWLLGSFTSSTWMDFSLVMIFLLLCLGLFVFYSRDLNLICLGTRMASSLGVNPSKLRLILLTGSSLLAAVCVSVSGIIGFVGLLIPHMVRGITGPDHFKLLPVSLLAGAILLLGADTVTRALLPSEIPIGVLTALIGGPFFFYVFRKRQMAI